MSQSPKEADWHMSKAASRIYAYTIKNANSCTQKWINHANLPFHLPPEKVLRTNQ